MTNQPDTAHGQTGPSVTDSWRSAIAARKTSEAEGATVPAAQVSIADQEATRRAFIRGAFWTGLGVSLLGSVVTLVDFLYPRHIAGFGGPVPAGNVSLYPKGGVPFHNLEGQFWIVNLDPAETRAGGSGGGDGIIALWHKCPHLGCTVPWRSGFSWVGDPGGWYRCPCHGSTYTKAGVRVFGPAPRSMDTMAVEVDENGNITVQTGQRTSGSPDNPQRAVPV